jgi:group I intron endonuclease
LHKLLNKKHHSLKFQNAVNKYGINNIEFDIIQECDPSLTIYIEQYWLTLLNTFRVGYNSCPTARSNAGYKHTDEAKLKMSKSKSGRQAWNKGLKGPSPSEETRAKLSVIAKGRKLAPMPEERKLAISKKLKEYYNNKYLLTLS